MSLGARSLEPAAAAATLCIVVGWFFTDTLLATVGPFRNGISFIELPVIIGNPAALITGVHRSNPLIVISFAFVCGLAVLAPLAPHFWKERVAWLALLAPLGLMCVCALLLYDRTAGSFIAGPEVETSLTSNVVRIANDLLGRGGAVAARRVSVGAGAYLAATGSIFLAVRGLLGFWAGKIAVDRSRALPS